MRSTLRAVLILVLLSAACVSGPRWQDVLNAGLKFGQCLTDVDFSKFTSSDDAGTPRGDAATDAPAE